MEFVLTVKFDERLPFALVGDVARTLRMVASELDAKKHMGVSEFKEGDRDSWEDDEDIVKAKYVVITSTSSESEHRCPNDSAAERRS